MKAKKRTMVMLFLNNRIMAPGDVNGIPVISEAVYKLFGRSSEKQEQRQRQGKNGMQESSEQRS